MPSGTKLIAIVAAALVLSAAAATAGPAQDVRPVTPTLDPPERPAPERPDDEERPDDTGVIPLPGAASRAAAAERSRSRSAVLPAAWSRTAAVYQPLWIGVGPPNAFGIERWTPYFAAAGLVPQLVPHPFLSPWGLLAYEGALFERYRALWPSARLSGRYAEAAAWLQRGDRAMARERSAEAVRAYRRATIAAPEMPLGYLGLGAALAEGADDRAAARALRMSVDRYPAWLAMDVDWGAIFVDPARLSRVQEAAEARADAGGDDSRFVAGVLGLFGGRVSAGRTLLETVADDPHAAALLSRGPR